jgi:GTP-binding protein Era
MERSGRVAIVGRPNVGKSTLLNALVGQKLAIVSARPGTTRSCLLGVHASEGLQIAFVDTPGLERPRSVLGRVLVEEAQSSLEEPDVILFLVEPGKKGEAKDAEILEQIVRTQKPVVLAINKVDKTRDKGALLPTLEAWSARASFAALVPISAKNGVNLDALLKELAALLPEGLLYDKDFLTDKPERFFVAERVREAILAHTRQEVPHGVAVQIEEMKEEPQITRIGAVILVDKASHKGILIGKRGDMLKAIGTAAREEIEAFLEKKVFLRLWVKVEEDWTRDPHKVRRLTRETD